MLQRNFGNRERAIQKVMGPPTEGPSFELASVFRYWRLFAGVVAGCLLAGLAYLLLRPPSYTAISRLVVDSRVLQMTQQHSVYTTSAATMGWAAPHVLSQVEVLRSQRVGARAIALLARDGNHLRLQPDRYLDRLLDLFMPAGTDSADAPLLARLLKALGARPAVERASLEDRLVEALRRKTTVMRMGETFAIEVRGQSDQPDDAARITNAIVAAYLEEIAAANAEASKGASPWLREMAREAGSTARVISNATPPLDRDGPGTMQVAFAALVGGLLAGLAAVIARDVFDRTVRSPDQAARLLGVECFGVLPRLADADDLNRGSANPLSRRRTKKSAAEHPPRFELALSDPSPEDAEIIERVRIAVKLEQPELRAVGITSAMRGDGATSVAATLALLSAQAGIPTLLVGLTETPTRPDRREKVEKGENRSDELVRDPGSGLAYLPGSATGEKPSRDLGRLLQHQAEPFDLVVVELPPLDRAADLRAASLALDAVLVVIGIGRTPAAAIVRNIDAAGRLGDRLIGSLLTR